jgi:hypothetical protein
MHGRSIVLLLTATINPGQTVMVARRDPIVRLGDYQRALREWLSADASRKVVVCENSGYDLASLKSIAAAYDTCEIEFISFFGNDSGASKGKGHAELEMIKYVFSVSKLINTSEIVVKGTGRLTVRNAAVLFQSISAREFDVMCTLRKHLSFADSRLFAATPAFFENYLMPRAAMIDDNAGVTFEHALACAIASAVSDRKQWRPFPNFPLIEGISGTDGRVMTNSRLMRMNKVLFHQLRNFVYRN